MDNPWNFHKCNLCSYSTGSLENFLSHETQHITRSKLHHSVCDFYSLPQYQCDQCQFQSDLKVHLTEHFNKAHITRGTQSYPTPALRNCKNCDFQTHSLLVWLSHKCCNRRGLVAKDKNSIGLVKEGKHSSQTPHTIQKKNGFFYCTYCSCEFTRKAYLRVHLRERHTPEDQIKWYQCGYCSHKTKRKQKLREHILARHSQPADVEKLKRFKCDQCPYKSRKGSHLKVHILAKHTPSEQINWHKCDQCSYKTVRKGDLRAHMRQQHLPAEEINWFKCKHCSHKAKQKAHLSKHMRTRHPGILEPKEEPKCSYKSIKNTSLREHQGLNGIQSYGCKVEISELSMDDSYNFHQHKSRNHPFTCDWHSPEKYNCEKCQFQSDLKVLLTEHFNTVHLLKKTQHYLTPVLKYCENCNFETYSSLVLLSHNNNCKRTGVSAKVLRRRLRSKDVSFRCSYCSYKSPRNADLKAHLLQKHTPLDQINWFKCELCPHKSKRKQKLREHMISKHTQPAELEKLKRFKCDICPYKARRRNHLRMHILVKHTPSEQINWHKCDRCVYKTRRSGDLKLHMRQQHGPSEQIRWFTCEHCSYKAKRKEHLRKHTQARHAETLERKELKYFKCDVCSYKSVISSNVRRHMFRKHST